MAITRSQEVDLEEFKAKTTSQKLDAIIGVLSRLLGNQRSDDQFTLDLSTTPSVKAKGSGSDHFERSGDDWRVDEEDRRFREYLMLRNDDDDETWTETDLLYRSEEENPEDQSLNDEELVETEVTTELNGIEGRAVENEANTKMISAKVKEESIPQSKVSIPQSNSEILKSSELGKVDLGLENEEYVVLNENLEQEWVQKKVKTSFEADGDVGKGQKMISDANICCAHKVFVKMPSKEKRIKHLKAWKFKFKSTSKRSRLMDSKFSFVDATVLLNKDSKEINWDCVNKEFKEDVAGCGKKIINPFKMVDETSKPAAYDGTFQIRVWDCGGSLLECVWWRRLKHCQRYCHEMQAIEAENKSIWMVTAWFKMQVFPDFDIASWIGLKIYGCEYKNHMLLLGYHGLEVQVLSCLQEFGEGSKTIMLCWKKLASFLWFLHGKKLLDAGQKMQSMLVSDFKTWVPHFDYELCLAGTDHVLGLVWSSFESDMNRLWRGPGVVLLFNSEDLVWFFQRGLHKSCLDIRRMIILLCSSADYRKLNLWVDTNYCAIQTDKTHVKLQEMSCFLSVKSLVEFVGYKAHGRELLIMGVKQLTLAATKFHLKHKWRSRLLQSFSELKQRMIVSFWKSFSYLMEAHGSKYKGLGCVVEKKKLIRLKLRDKEIQIAMPLAPKIFKVHHMLNYLVIAEAAAPIYPTVGYLSQFSSKVGIVKEHSSSSLRANQIWDPGGKISLHLQLPVTAKEANQHYRGKRKSVHFETETLRSRFCKGGRCDTVWYVWAARVNTKNMQCPIPSLHVARENWKTGRIRPLRLYIVTPSAFCFNHRIIL